MNWDVHWDLCSFQEAAEFIPAVSIFVPVFDVRSCTIEGVKRRFKVGSFVRMQLSRCAILFDIEVRIWFNMSLPGIEHWV